VLLEHLRDGDEDTRGKSHVEDAVSLFLTLLQPGEVLLEALEVLVLVVFFTVEVCAEATELLQLLLNLACGGCDVRSDTLDELFVAHLASCISDDLDTLREEVVLVL